jgi:hypothetical protein
VPYLRRFILSRLLEDAFDADAFNILHPEAAPLKTMGHANDVLDTPPRTIFERLRDRVEGRVKPLEKGAQSSDDSEEEDFNRLPTGNKSADSEKKAERKVI